MAYRILVAEDDGDIVQVLKLYLNNEGYEVLHAPNGAEALEIMEQQASRAPEFGTPPGWWARS